MIHKYIVIPKDKKNEANEFCNSIGAVGETFDTPLFKNDVHTHYWTGWMMTPEQYAEIAKKYTTHFDSYMETLEVTGLEVKSGVDE